MHNSISKTKVFSLERFTKTFETDYRFTVVVYGCVESENNRNLKMRNLVAAVYCRGERVGSSGYRPSKLISVPKKSLSLDQTVVSGLIKDAIQDAYRSVLSQKQVFNATIIYWNEHKSSGMAQVHGVGTVEIHGCNAFNALTCYDETSCISMTKGENFSCTLSYMGRYLTISNYTGTFDQAKSDTLNHDKLAFKKKNGQLVSGLFA